MSGRGFEVFQIDKALSCPAHAMTVTGVVGGVPGVNGVFENIRGAKAQTSTGPSWPIRLISLSQLPRFMIATELTGPFTALAAAIWDPSGDQEHRRKYVVKGDSLNGLVIVVSTVKLVCWSCAVALAAGEVKRKILMLLSSLAVAKYLFAGSKVSPLTCD